VTATPRRILVVEDSPAMRQLLRLAVARVPDAVVDEAGDGVAALKAIAQASYDLVLLDLNMPFLDGLKLLGKLREEPSARDTVVCVVTTSEGDEIERQARKLGARHFVRKPVSRRALDAILAEVFGPRPPAEP